jgi:hypothetical protein
MSRFGEADLAISLFRDIGWSTNPAPDDRIFFDGFDRSNTARPGALTAKCSNRGPGRPDQQGGCGQHSRRQRRLQDGMLSAGTTDS